MSTTGNEYEQPGVNHPAREDVEGAEPTEGDALRTDEPSHVASGVGTEGFPGGGASSDAAGDASADHHGQDGGRETLTAGESQAALSGEQEQRLPAMAQNNASDVDKIAGIVAQTRQDVSHLGRDEIIRVLKQRFEQTGLEVSDDETAELADQITVGDARD